MPDPIKPGNKYQAQLEKTNKARESRLQNTKNKISAINNAAYNKKVESYRSDRLSLEGDKSNLWNATTKSDINKGTTTNRHIRSKESRIKKFQNELFNYDTKNKKGSTDGYTSESYADYKAGGGSKGKVDIIKDKVKTPIKDKVTPPVIKKEEKNKTTSGKMAALGSSKRKAQYDKNNWKYDDTIEGYNRDGSAKNTRKKVKAVSAIKGGNKINDVVKDKAPVLAKKRAKPDSLRAEKLRAKGTKALKDGNKTKAHNIRKRYDAVVKRDAKK